MLVSVTDALLDVSDLRVSELKTFLAVVRSSSLAATAREALGFPICVAMRLYVVSRPIGIFNNVSHTLS